MPRSTFLVRLFAAAVFVTLTLDVVAAERQPTRRPMPSPIRAAVSRSPSRPQPKPTIHKTTATMQKPRPIPLPGTARPQPQPNRTALRKPIAPIPDGTGSRGNPSSVKSIHFPPRRPPAPQPKDNTLEKMRLHAQIDLAKRRERTELVHGILGGVAGIVQGAASAGQGIPAFPQPDPTYFRAGSYQPDPNTSIPLSDLDFPQPEVLETVYPEEGQLFYPE